MTLEETIQNLERMKSNKENSVPHCACNDCRKLDLEVITSALEALHDYKAQEEFRDQ